MLISVPEGNEVTYEIHGYTLASKVPLKLQEPHVLWQLDTLCMVKYKYIILYMEFGVILYTPHKQFYILPQAEELVHVKD